MQKNPPIIFKPPNFADEHKTRRAEFLHYSSILLFVSTSILFWINMQFGTQAAKSASWLLGIIAFFQIIVQWMIRKGYVNQASFTLLSIGWAALTAINWKVGGIRDEGVFGYVLILLVSGYLLGWQAAVAYSLVTISALWWLASIEMNGLISPVIDDAYSTARDLTVVFILIFLVVYFLISTLSNALENAQRELIERTRIEAEREGLIAQLSEEIVERRHAQAELHNLARTDSLTGLYNRRYFYEIAEKEFSKSIRYNRPLSLLLFDIDLFKGINDTYGHLAGDQALIQLGKLLHKISREVDTAARYGGEEFVVLLPETTHSGAQIFAERLRRSVEELVVQYDNNSIRFTVSVGVAGLTDNQNAETFDDLILQADQALYKAKQKGRNRVVCYPAEGGKLSF